jgi:hypothetical protein
LIFVDGEIRRKVKAEDMYDELILEIERKVQQQKTES